MTVSTGSWAPSTRWTATWRPTTLNALKNWKK